MRFFFAVLTILILSTSTVAPSLAAFCQQFDLNGNGEVSLAGDGGEISFRFGVTPGHIHWNSNFDLNKDGVINEEDETIWFESDEVLKCDGVHVSGQTTTDLNPLPTDTGKVTDPIPLAVTAGGLGGILTEALAIAVAIAGMVALLIIIWSGFRYMTAQGDEKAIASARSTLTGAVIGLVIILSLGVIAFLLDQVFGVFS